jgi:hypothetical protein
MHEREADKEGEGEEKRRGEKSLIQGAKKKSLPGKFVMRNVNTVKIIQLRKMKTERNTNILVNFHICNLILTKETIREWLFDLVLDFLLFLF